MERPRVCGYCSHWSCIGFCPNHRYAPDLDNPGCLHYGEAGEEKLCRIYPPDGCFDVEAYAKRGIKGETEKKE